MFSAQVNIEFLLQLDETLLASSRDQGLASVHKLQPAFRSLRLPLPRQNGERRALSQAKVSFTDLGRGIKISHNVLPLFSHDSPLSARAADAERLKANAGLSSLWFSWTSACNVCVINTHKDEVTIPPSTRGHGSHRPRSPPSPRPEQKRMAIWKLILSKV